MATREYRRRWQVNRAKVAGLLSCDDVSYLKAQIHTYRAQLEASASELQKKGWSWPMHNEARSAQTWADLAGLVARYEAESCTLPILASGQYERGRDLVKQLDEWRDWLATQRAPGGEAADVPAPVPVPHSQVDIAEGIGWALAAIVLIMVLRELR
jgi:hypothetical protein